ncbi:MULTISPECIES: hypothetical protein [unclassified Tolypothrix]|uniref:hypothetical protein n=1 Tax=unclassified Tolypothrix TaxID=2649714 RepID=UPI0005EAA6A5|nr:MULTISPECIES: hypothetical protein [unclassified Tolypothrix]BAY93354.1 hypothetical protein NIES3275_53930 [Microchaete diplosiphon NIES-3275]EKF00128.1 hypothetical protein FDUTEX481_09336 [Tolypothrix sp. PCC 7601]MBE9085484.1 hypothetical protein [Tolypothrix sp. LEGE 11397]UYD27206.1 hypothetical protein HGR01_03640 [Tolypothrix sp. PCC 7712]UYD36934.1 hypothetical protein HG267_15105 [Tolypothrix sp. PCC 7601]
MKEIVEQALTTGYLTIAAQNQIQSLLASDYDSDDLDAYIILQRAVVAGDVTKEARHHQTAVSSTPKDKASNIKLAYQVAAELACVAAMALSLPKNTNDSPYLGA